ncbi:hypothetical protein [Endozoicomonas montiporae]|uniref:Lipoprotein n=1 Tax=Endozoicomonas montiporae CL-33 TaxID=570277 RepID=A0A142BIF4_9GAMM|nr:hypothetical protein [Endozoicomonas montiporae]AMO58530.1 hypothetical protein EZMO1_4623 [Endozoicomonas montiporae CL-33]
MKLISAMAMLLLSGVLSGVLTGCSVFGNSSGTMDKIQFDLNRLDELGLQGQPDSLLALSYEFCIPDNINYVSEVMAIDPTVVVYKQSPGRIGCTEQEYLCIGNTATDDYLEVLKNLSKLRYVKEIREAFFE